jgi:hypothetical protein
MSEDTEREAYRRGASAAFQYAFRVFGATDPDRREPLSMIEIREWLWQCALAVERGEWPKGDTDAKS